MPQTIQDSAFCLRSTKPHTNSVLREVDAAAVRKSKTQAGSRSRAKNGQITGEGNLTSPVEKGQTPDRVAAAVGMSGATNAGRPHTVAASAPILSGLSRSPSAQKVLQSHDLLVFSAHMDAPLKKTHAKAGALRELLQEGAVDSWARTEVPAAERVVDIEWVAGQFVWIYRIRIRFCRGDHAAGAM